MCDAKLFWIAGKPASGKSTLINYIAKHRKTREFVEGAFGEVIVARFFFDFRGEDGIENNFEGLRRSLLYQMLMSSSALATDVKEHFGVNHLDDQIILASASIFEYALHKDKRLSLLFIDGLDEYQGQKPSLLNLIDSITKFKVKVCLSSRYETPFTFAFKDLAFQFRMDVLNQPGIYAYATGTFETTMRPSNDRERRVLENSATEIARKSTGVFLWAQFAVLQVIKRKCRGHEIDSVWIQEIVATMPPDLEHIYARVFLSLEDEDKTACGIILQLITSARRDLELPELLEASLLAGNDFRSLKEVLTTQDLVDFQAYLVTVAGGIIDFVPTKREREWGENVSWYITSVRLVHRSVHTYLWKRGWRELLGKQQAVKSHHELWLDVCSDYLKGKHVIWASLIPRHWSGHTKEDRNIDHISPIDWGEDTNSLHDYVHTSLPYHASKFEQETARSSWPLIHDSLDAKFIYEHGARIGASRSESCSGCFDISQGYTRSLLYGHVQLAVCHHLLLYVKEALVRCPEAFSPDRFNGDFLVLARPLDYMLRDVQLLSVPTPRRSPLATAVLCYLIIRNPGPERLRLVLFLIPHSPRLDDDIMLKVIMQASGAFIEALLVQFPKGPLQLCNTQNPPRSLLGPLWALGRRKDLDRRDTAEVLRLFLARGENINSPCSPDGTVLHAVIRYQPPDLQRLESFFRMLFSHGADINAPGPKGNMLEYIWKEVHEETVDRARRAFFKSSIETLIQMGATNSTCDPNGLVPSRARMLAVAKMKGPSVADKRYYSHGACSSDKDETACCRFVCRSMLSQVHRFSAEKFADPLQSLRRRKSLERQSKKE